MEIKLSKDELAIMRWIYERASGFTQEQDYWVNSLRAIDLKKELNMTEERYKRAMSLLRDLGLAVVKRGRLDDSPQAEQGDWIRLTGQGVNAYRHLVPQAEWDIEYKPAQFTKTPE
jgi:hypothetical protein